VRRILRYTVLGCGSAVGGLPLTALADAVVAMHRLHVEAHRRAAPTIYVERAD
jgi:hypothetical protein